MIFLKPRYPAMQSTDYCRGSYRYNNNGYVRIIRATIHIPLNIRTYTIHQQLSHAKIEKSQQTSSNNKKCARQQTCRQEYNLLQRFRFFFSLSLMSTNIPVTVYSTLFCWVKLWIGVRHFWRINLRCHCM